MEDSQQREGLNVGKQKRSHKRTKKHKSSKNAMPSCVVSYFRYRQQGLSKVAARKKAGMGKK